MLSAPRLEDGLPRLISNIVSSPPSVPTEASHASCERIVRDLPSVSSVPEAVASGYSHIWTHVSKNLTNDGFKYLTYSTESDIVYIVKLFMTDILKALDLPITFGGEITIKHVRPDLLCALVLEKYLVGVVEIKKPGENVLMKPTVLGELLDQMLLVEGFYGMGPVIGILTTGEHWVISWFPQDSEFLSTQRDVVGSDFVRLGEFASPLRSPSASEFQAATALTDLSIAPSIPTFTEEEDNAEITRQQMGRRLCTTPVMSIYGEPYGVLRQLTSAFQLMAMSRRNYHRMLPFCLLKFQKGKNTVTFHPINSFEQLYERVQFNSFPSNNTKNLLALEDLGSGSTGKAWLCATVTQPRSAACVLKFHITDPTGNDSLTFEHSMWETLYRDFLGMVKLEMWSGSAALVMPYFPPVLEQERDHYKDEIREVLTNTFMAKGKVHTGAIWVSIAKKELVMFQ